MSHNQFTCFIIEERIKTLTAVVQYCENDRRSIIAVVAECRTVEIEKMNIIMSKT